MKGETNEHDKQIYEIMLREQEESPRHTSVMGVGTEREGLALRPRPDGRVPVSGPPVDSINVMSTGAHGHLSW